MDVRRLHSADGALLAAAVGELMDGGRVANDDHLERALNDPAAYFIVAVVDANPVGYLSAFRFPAVEVDAFRVYLYDLVVDESFRRRGVAARMIRELERHCAHDDVEHIWAGTAIDNEAAQKTLESCGGRRVSDNYVEYIIPAHARWQKPIR